MGGLMEHNGYLARFVCVESSRCCPEAVVTSFLVQNSQGELPFCFQAGRWTAESSFLVCLFSSAFSPERPSCQDGIFGVTYSEAF